MSSMEERLARVESELDHTAKQVDVVTAVSAVSNQITSLESKMSLTLWAFAGVFLLLLSILAALLGLIPNPLG